MWLGMTSVGIPEKMGCANLPLSGKQREICRKKPYLMASIKDGARLGIAECQSQFKHERWNCSTTKDLSVFGYELTSGTKETAFIYALMTAGLVHAVTRACSGGNMTECSCDLSLQGSGSASEGWHWGGCSDDIQYGTWFSRRFLDQGVATLAKHSKGGATSSSPNGGDGSTNTSLVSTGTTATVVASAIPADVVLVMNQHNSEAGRQAVARTMSTDCRCHGVSGSCAVKTCWRTMAPFERVGRYLKERYEHSVQVMERTFPPGPPTTAGPSSTTKTPVTPGGGKLPSTPPPTRIVRRREKGRRRVPLGAEELVFVRKSPNYCVEDSHAGVAGTRGRRCNRGSGGADGCGLLCCGRGYNTHVVRHVERCDCKFIWCCYVRCRRCESMNDIHTCK